MKGAGWGSTPARCLSLSAGSGSAVLNGSGLPVE